MEQATTTDLQWGAAAVATSGGVTVEVDEAVDGTAEVLQMNLDCPAFYLSVRLDRPACLVELLGFLDGQGHIPADDDAGGELLVSHSHASRTSFLRDDEGTGRYFIRITGAHHTARLTLLNEDVAHLVSALGDAIAQLTN